MAWLSPRSVADPVNVQAASIRAEKDPVVIIEALFPTSLIGGSKDVQWSLGRGRADPNVARHRSIVIFVAAETESHCAELELIAIRVIDPIAQPLSPITSSDRNGSPEVIQQLEHI